jgi:hypothetical protein
VNVVANREIYFPVKINIYICHDLALQVVGFSDETVKYGREFCGTSTQLLFARPRSNCTVSYRPVLSSERAPHIKKQAIVTRKTKNLVVGPRWAPDTKTD